MASRTELLEQRKLVKEFLAGLGPDDEDDRAVLTEELEKLKAKLRA